MPSATRYVVMHGTDRLTEKQGRRLLELIGTAQALRPMQDDNLGPIADKLRRCLARTERRRGMHSGPERPRDRTVPAPLRQERRRT